MVSGCVCNLAKWTWIARYEHKRWPTIACIKSFYVKRVGSAWLSQNYAKGRRSAIMVHGDLCSCAVILTQPIERYVFCLCG